MRLVRRIWKLVAFSVTIVAWASWIAMRVRRTAEPERARLRAEGQRAACRRLSRILGVRVSVSGGPPPDGAHLAVSNHLGMLDGFSLASALSIAFVAKREMADWPVMGWICRTVGFLFIDRDRRSDASRLVGDMDTRMRAGVPVLVFPEGTVGDGERLLPFRTGAFESVAGVSGLSVLPLRLCAEEVDGAADTETIKRIVWHDGESMGAHVWRVLGLRRIHVRLCLGDPIPAEGKDRKHLAEASFAAVQALCGRSG